MARFPKQDLAVVQANELKTEAEKLAEKATGYTVATAKDSESKK
jgi:hypothetical protein